MVWLSDNYIYRRKITISSPEVLPAGHFVDFVLPPEVASQGKLRDDLAGIEVVRDSDGFVSNLTTTSQTDGSVDVSFVLASGEQDSYYVYYGNLELVSPPTRDATAFVNYPITHSKSSGSISYQRPGEDWDNGISETSQSRASFTGYLKDSRITFASGPDKGIAEVKLLGGDWTEVDTFAVSTGTKNYDLSSTSSELQHLQIRNSGRSNLSSSNTKIELVSIALSLPHEVELGLEEVNLDAL